MLEVLRLVVFLVMLTGVGLCQSALKSERGFISNRWIICCHFFSSWPDRILKESSKVFEDVLESFYSIDCIKSQFEAWRSKYFASYKDAYIGLCLPKLFNPLIRLQLLVWTPLEVRSWAHNIHRSFCIVWFSHTSAEQSELYLCFL